MKNMKNYIKDYMQATDKMYSFLYVAMTPPSTFSNETKTMSALTVTEQILWTPKELITIDSSER